MLPPSSLLACAWNPVEEVSRGAPNVLIVIADDIAVSDLEGLPLPNLERLASSGIVYTRAFANPVCSPSRRSLFFSEWYWEESGEVCAQRPTGEEPSLARTSIMDLARTAGLRAGLFGKWHVGTHPEGGAWEATPLVHGFDRWRGTPMNMASCGGSDYSNWLFSDGLESWLEGDYSTTLVRDEMFAFLSESGPKLTVWAPALAHGPFHRPPEDLLPSGWPETPDARAQFESMIVSLDLVLGQVLDRIDLAETYVVFVGDNGTPPQVAPDPSRAKGTTFERGIHIPMIVAGPGLGSGRDDRLVHLVDVLPTLADLLGLQAPAEAAGTSLLAPEARGWVACGGRNQTRGTLDQCVRSRRFKLRRHQLRLGSPPREELFDLWLDPEERSPIAVDDPSHQDVVAKHRSWLEEAF